MEYELVDKNCARTFNISEEIKQEVKTTVKDHISYTDEEIELLCYCFNVFQQNNKIIYF